jgi:hypothetical protein
MMMTLNGAVHVEGSCDHHPRTGGRECSPTCSRTLPCRATATATCPCLVVFQGVKTSFGPRKSFRGNGGCGLQPKPRV